MIPLSIRKSGANGWFHPLSFQVIPTCSINNSWIVSFTLESSKEKRFLRFDIWFPVATAQSVLALDPQFFFIKVRRDDLKLDWLLDCLKKASKAFFLRSLRFSSRKSWISVGKVLRNSSEFARRWWVYVLQLRIFLQVNIMKKCFDKINFIGNHEVSR